MYMYAYIHIFMYFFLFRLIFVYIRVYISFDLFRGLRLGKAPRSKQSAYLATCTQSYLYPGMGD